MLFGRHAGVVHDPEPMGIDWKEGQHPHVVPEDAHLVWGDRPADVDVGQGPVVRLGLPGELQGERVPHRAVGTIATDEPGRDDRFLSSVGVPNPASHRVRRLLERELFDLALDDHALLREVLG